MGDLVKRTPREIEEIQAATDAEVQAAVEAEIEAEKDAYVFKPPALTFKAGVFTIENSDFAKREMEGVAVLSKKVRGYWPEGSEDLRPECSSSEGRVGVARDGATFECANCQCNEWGSDPKGGKGKACGEYRLLLVVPQGMSAPVRLRLPVTSIGNWDEYISGLRVTQKGQSYFTVVTKFGLTKAVREGNQEYFVANFARVRSLDVPELRGVLVARKEFEDILARVRTQDLVGEKETESEDASAKVEAAIGPKELKALYDACRPANITPKGFSEMLWNRHKVRQADQLTASQAAELLGYIKSLALEKEVAPF